MAIGDMRIGKESSYHLVESSEKTRNFI